MKSRKRKKNKGSTMVEVLVGFTILMILMAGLTRIIEVSSNMVFSTQDILKEQDAFLEQFYQTGHGSLNKSGIAFDITMVETDSTGENPKAGGVQLRLDHAQAEKVTDSSSGLHVYQIDYQ
jgi:Tfp pilus assembly protein PilE